MDMSKHLVYGAQYCSKLSGFHGFSSRKPQFLLFSDSGLPCAILSSDFSQQFDKFILFLITMTINTYNNSKLFKKYLFNL